MGGALNPLEGESAVRIQLGDEVRCRITGFTGIAVARTDWIFGCVRFGVQPQAMKEDGSGIHEAQWHDEASLERIGDGLAMEAHAEEGRDPGGPSRPHGARSVETG